MKVITLCGSLKFKNEMMKVAEQLVEIMSDIIKNPVASKYANLAIACLQYPEVQLVNTEEQGSVKKLVPNNKK